MPFIYKAECGRCDYQGEIIWPQWACYQWPLGNTMEIAQQWIWCSRCSSVRIGEALTDIERIKRLQAIPVIENTYDGNRKVWAADEIETALDYAWYPRFTNLYAGSMMCKRWDIKQSVIFFETLKLHREWRLARVSAARCLTCGGEDFIPLVVGQEGEPESIVHPACGGSITVHKSRKVRAKRLLWTTEGQFISAG